MIESMSRRLLLLQKLLSRENDKLKIGEVTFDCDIAYFLDQMCTSASINTNSTVFICFITETCGQLSEVACPAVRYRKRTFLCTQKYILCIKYDGTDLRVLIAQLLLVLVTPSSPIYANRFNLRAFLPKKNVSRIFCE